MALKQISGRSVRIRRKTYVEILDDLRDRFFRVYPNLPLMERPLPCIVLKIKGRSEPLSWRVCYMEIKGKTKLSVRILHWLGKMEFI